MRWWEIIFGSLVVALFMAVIMASMFIFYAGGFFE
jgi:hypothetical protein